MPAAILSLILSSLRSYAGQLAAGLLALVLVSSPGAAASGWTLDPVSSTLSYQSVKKNTIVETNQIRNLTGTLSAKGDARVVLDLNSVDTGIDIRNVRMRFLFFETFKFPAATVTAKVDPAAFADLPAKRRMTAKLPFRLDLHGVDKDYEAEVVVTMITDTSVSIASKSPVAVDVEDFGLLPNVEKLKQAANITSILPTASVSFDFIFGADGAAPPVSTAAAAAPEKSAAQTLMLGAAAPVMATDATKTAYSDEECRNRFDVLSKTGAIYFASGSSKLDPKSQPVLDSVVDAVRKCPAFRIEVAAHTDALGSLDDNRWLSLLRARSVAKAIRRAGVAASRITAAGYGADRPVAPNDTEENRALNRRIEFSASPMTN